MPQNNSVIIDKFLAANGVVLAKTRMHELAYGVTSINPYFGPVLNPYNNTCHTGGVLKFLLCVSHFQNPIVILSGMLHAGQHLMHAQRQAHGHSSWL